jgi:DNA-binding SARP family transcriptional activator
MTSPISLLPPLALETSRSAVTLVGDVTVCVNGTPVPVPPMAARVIAFLAVHDRPVRRAYVSGSLWPEVDERHAGACLRTALWRMPSAGACPLVQVSSSCLMLDPTVRVDVREVARLGAMLDTGCPQLPHWDEVAAILRSLSDDLLAGWYDEWAAAERERFHQARLHLLDSLGEQLFVEHRLREALEVGLAIVRVEPLHESGHRLILRVHLHEGNVADAFRRFHGYAARLARELGATPSPAMIELLRPYRLRG